jgi:hypothetical protein
MPENESSLVQVFSKVQYRSALWARDAGVTNGDPVPGERTGKGITDCQELIRAIGADADTTGSSDEELVCSGRSEIPIGFIGPDKGAVMVCVGSEACSKAMTSLCTVVTAPRIVELEPVARLLFPPRPQSVHLQRR